MPQTESDRPMKKHAFWIERSTWAASGLAVWIAFFLPWCSTVRGIDIARTSSYAGLWAVPIAGTVLLLAALRRPRLHVNLAAFCAAAVALAAGLYAAHRVGRLRGSGVIVTIIAASAAAAAAVSAIARGRGQPEIPPPETTP
jgi:hypothetical protein